MLSILLKRQSQAKAKEKAKEQQAVTAKAKQAPGQSGESARSIMGAKPWEETQAMLKQDVSYLRTLAGSQEKDPYKTELVNKYRPLVEKLLASHSNLDNLDVVWFFFQWQIDLGQLDQVHDRFREAIGQGLETPKNWKANGQTTYCDIVFKHAHNAHANKVEFKRDYMLNAVNDLLDGTLATNAPLKVKMFRLVGNWHYEAGEKEKAFKLFELVMKLDPKKGGVKTKLKELKEELGYGDPH